MEGYRPDAAKVVWGSAAGWPRRKIDALRPSRRAKIEMYKSTFKKYTSEMQDAVIAGRIPDRADEVAVSLAWGEPDYVWHYDSDCSALLYAVDRENPALVGACGGEVDEVVPLLRPISCEVLGATAERARSDKKAFGRLTRDQQLDVLAKHRASWMDATALKLSFGEKNPRSQGLGPIRSEEGVAANLLPSNVTPPTRIAAPAVAPVASPVPAPTPGPSDAVVAVPAPAADPEEPGRTGSDEDDPAAEGTETVAPAPAPPPAPASAASVPVDRLPLRFETTSVGTWQWDSVCGESTYSFEADIGDGYRVRATSRPGDGEIVRFVTQGDAELDAGEVRLFGFADGKVDGGTLTLSLSTWPVPSCKGVGVQVQM